MRRFLRSRLTQSVLASILLLGLMSVVAELELGRDLSRLKVGFLSGSAEGNYHAIVDAIAVDAAKRNGAITNVATAGSVENLARLATPGCAAAFALIQDGQEWPAKPKLELLGKLPRSESVFLFGKSADAITDVASLKGMRIGIGPEGSGAAKIAADLLRSRDIDGLGIVTSHHPLGEQLAMAAKGDLDLAVMVIDEDAPIVDAAIREQGLQIASLPHAGVLVGKVPHVHTGVIGAGHYDPVRLLPPTDKTVLQVDTLLVGNRCAGRSSTVGMLSLMTEVFPDFVRVNRTAPNLSGLPLAAASKSFFENDGPEAFDEYAPWLADIMPPGKWVYIVTALSLLFNAMGFGHRFQLWRIDARRVQLERDLTASFGPTITMGDIERLSPSTLTPEVLSAVDRVVKDMEALAERSRKMSLSILVPMGQEMAYRYQEEIIHETLTALRGLMTRSRK